MAGGRSSDGDEDGARDGHTFDGVVLTGGRSKRMGTDKARLEVDGQALAARTAALLVDAGAESVVCVGGATDALRSMGLTAIDDLVPDQGPLGGMLTGLEATTADMVVMLACDMPLIGRGEIERIVATLRSTPAADVAAPRLDGRWQFLTAAWRRRADAQLRLGYDAGERSVRKVVSRSLEVVEVPLDHPELVEDADTPEDLQRLLRRRD